jgi:hypothetical protein
MNLAYALWLGGLLIWFIILIVWLSAFGRLLYHAFKRGGKGP